MIHSSIEIGLERLSIRTPAAGGLPEIHNEPLKKIVLDFLRSAESAQLSISCRKLYDRFQSNERESSASLWMNLFERDFPRLALEATRILVEKAVALRLSPIEVCRVQTQFYRIRATLPYECKAKFGSSVLSLVALPGGLLASTFINDIEIWNLHDGSTLDLPSRRFEGSSGRVWYWHPTQCCIKHTGVNCLTVLSDGRLVSGSRDGVHICNVQDGSCVPLTMDFSATCLTVLPDERLAIGTRDNAIHLLTLGGQHSPLQIENSRGTTSCLATLPDGNLVSGHAANDSNKSVCDGIRFWNTSALGLGPWKDFPEYSINCCTILPGGILAVGLTDFRAILHNLGDRRSKIHLFKDGKLQKRLSGHKSTVKCLTVLTHGLLASASQDEIRLWTQNGEEANVVKGLEHYVFCIAALPEGGFASGGDGIRIWDVNPTELVDRAITRAKYMASGQRSYRRSCAIM